MSNVSESMLLISCTMKHFLAWHLNSIPMDEYSHRSNGKKVSRPNSHFTSESTASIKIAYSLVYNKTKHTKYIFFYRKVVYKKVVLDCSKVKKIQYWISEKLESCYVDSYVKFDFFT